MNFLKLNKPFFKKFLINNYPCLKASFCEKTIFKIDLSPDIETARKQVLWRARNIGQLELEFLVGKWINEHIKSMNMVELSKFTKEVLEKEVVDLDAYLLKNKELPNDSEYIRKIKDHFSKTR